MLVIKQEYKFADLEERSKWINLHFPKRKCTQTPGCYRITRNISLGVFLLTATVYVTINAGK